MEIAELIGVLFLIMVALWRRDTFLYIIGGPVCFAFGFGWYDYYSNPHGLITSMAFAGMGIFLWVLAVENIIDWIKMRRRQ